RRAEELARTSFGAEDRFTLTSMGNRAEMLSHRDLATARLLQEQVLEDQRRTLGPDHRVTVSTMNNLGPTLMKHGDGEGAVLRFEEVLEIETRQRRFGGEETKMATMNNLARALWLKGERQRAWEVQSSLVLTCIRALGRGHLHTVDAMNNLNDM